MIFINSLTIEAEPRMCPCPSFCKINDDGDIESIEQTYGIEETLPEKLQAGWKLLRSLALDGMALKMAFLKVNPLKTASLRMFSHSYAKHSLIQAQYRK